MGDRWATFDCYGTLVDWNTGIGAALGDATLLERYHEVEPLVQAENPGRRYRDVLRETARRLGVDADPAASLPDWPVFDDVRDALGEARARGWLLGILTNSDRDLIEASIQSIGVPFRPRHRRVRDRDPTSRRPTTGRHSRTRSGGCRTCTSPRATSTTWCRRRRSASRRSGSIASERPPARRRRRGSSRRSTVSPTHSIGLRRPRSRSYSITSSRIPRSGGASLPIS